MAHKYGRLEALRSELPLQDLGLGSMKAAVERAWDGIMPSVALQGVWVLLRRMNSHIDLTKPWQLAKGNVAELDAVLGACCEALRWAALHGGARDADRFAGDPAPARTRKGRGDLAGRVSLARRRARRAEARLPADRARTAGRRSWPAGCPPRPRRRAAPAPAAAPSPKVPAVVTFEDFGKMDLRAARVVAAEPVAKADKLLKLTLDIGGELRTVVSGIAPAYAAETMVGRTVIYLANLAPRKIRGV